jgi:hypothetical protein
VVVALEVKLYSGRAAQYSLSLTTSAAPVASTCEPDRYDDGSYGAPNDSAASAPVIGFQTYSDLTACDDEDWFSVSGSLDRPVVVYLRSDDPFAYVTAEQYGEALDVTTEDVEDGVDGCYAPYGVSRAYCRRAEVRSAYEGYVDFRVTLTLADGDYDMLVRSGEEVSATCETDSECALGFECLDNIDYSYFTYNTCSKPCSSYSDCGGARRECVESSSSYLAGSCFQECDSAADCRSGFTCESKQSVGGYSTSVCVPF